MSLLIAALIGLLALTAARDRGGRLRRFLVERPARFLNQLTWRHVAIVVLAVIFVQLFAQMAMPHLGVILAVDVVGWIDVLAATLIVTRLAPGWRALKVWVGRLTRIAPFTRARASRPRRIRRPMATSDDPDPAGGLAFA